MQVIKENKTGCFFLKQCIYAKKYSSNKKANRCSLLPCGMNGDGDRKVADITILLDPLTKKNYKALDGSLKYCKFNLKASFIHP